MKQYLDLLQNILDNGEVRTDRTGVGTISIFGTQTKYDLREGFPLLTTKKMQWASIVKELLWFLSGSTNTKDLGCGIWDAWADEEGRVGKSYGYQWRKWEVEDGADWDGIVCFKHVDQIQNAIDLIKTNPDSRRIIVSAWNVSDVLDLKLPPCHVLFQFYVTSGRLDCQMYQRSADCALGVPFNIASYALLMVMVAQECNLVPGIFTHTIGDAHIYLNQIEGVKEQLTRTPGKLPSLVVAKKPFDEIRFEDIQLIDYKSQPTIKFPIAV